MDVLDSWATAKARGLSEGGSTVAGLRRVPQDHHPEADANAAVSILCRGVGGGEARTKRRQGNLVSNFSRRFSPPLRRSDRERKDRADRRGGLRPRVGPVGASWARQPMSYPEW